MSERGSDDDARVTLDEESPAAVRVTFVILTAVAACVCILPRQWASAGILGAVSAATLAAHVWLGRRRPSDRISSRPEA